MPTILKTFGLSVTVAELNVLAALSSAQLAELLFGKAIQKTVFEVYKPIFEWEDEALHRFYHLRRRLHNMPFHA